MPFAGHCPSAVDMEPAWEELQADLCKAARARLSSPAVGSKAPPEEEEGIILRPAFPVPCAHVTHTRSLS